MVPRWLARGPSGRRAGARNAAVPSPGGRSDPNVKLLPAGTSPSPRTTGNLTPAVRLSVSAEAPAASSLASVSNDARDVAMEMARKVLAPPPLDGLDGGTMLAVASVPGKVPEEWRPVAPGVWIAWPHAAGAIHAKEMTVGQLRDLLTARDEG